MGASINYEKKLYQSSELGKLEAKVRRFYNITELAEKFKTSSESMKVRKIREKAEKEYSDMADRQGKVEQKLLDLKKANEKELEEKLTKYLKQEVEVLVSFEKSFIR